MREKIFEILDSLFIEYKNYEHKPVFTCEESKWIDIPWYRVKSLLLRNKRATRYYMIVLWEEKSLDSNSLRHTLWENKLSFASEERMIAKIWVKPWHVSPFANINDDDRDIKVIFDEVLKWELIWFHPLRNDNTVVLNMTWVEKFLDDLWVEYTYLSL